MFARKLPFFCPKQIQFRFFSQEASRRIFILEYKFAPDFYYLRIPHRESHQKLIESLENEKDTAIFGGSHFPYDGATLIFYTNNEETPKEFLKKDPYKVAGLVLGHSLIEVEQNAGKKAKELSVHYSYR